MDPLYCKLYIDTDETKADVEAALALISQDEFKGVSVEMPVFENEDFDIAARARTPYSSIDCSRYYSEVGTIDSALDQVEAFQSGVAAMVGRLRKSERIVSASCSFEDVIISTTGWNWTKTQPEPPGRKAT